jgi:hypothetical protein
MGLWQKAYSAPGVVFLGGIVFWGLAWGIDAATHIQAYGFAEGAHVHGGDAVIRVNMTVTGFPLVAFGLAQLMGTDTLLKRGGMPLYLAAMFLMVDGLAHAFAMNDHLGEPASAAFFAFLSPLQIAVGASLPFASRARDRWLVLATLGLLGLYVVSRTVAFPPLRWPERVEALDVFSKAMEVLFILSVLTVARVEREQDVARGAHAQRSPPSADAR